jgi:hypothetical protein
VVSQLEFPFTAQKSLEFGLFRTYGIPTISKLLCSTKELTHEVGRRYDDTELLLREVYENDVDEVERAMRAVRRMNFIHSKYKISNGDYLYTLSVFVCEPIRWIDRFEWRKLTQRERDGLYVFWREIGIRMGIKNIPPSVDAFLAFNEEYEAKHMKFAPSNRTVANATIDLFLSLVPLPALRDAGDAVVRSFMDQRLCKTFGLAPAPEWVHTFIVTLLKVRAFVVRHLFLPRAKLNRRTPERPMDGKSPARYCPLYTMYEDTYPNGYVIEKLGPKKFENEPTQGVVHERKADSIAHDDTESTSGSDDNTATSTM